MQPITPSTATAPSPASTSHSTAVSRGLRTVAVSLLVDRALSA